MRGAGHPPRRLAASATASRPRAGGGGGALSNPSGPPQCGIRKRVLLPWARGACPGTLEAAPAPLDWAARPLDLAVGRARALLAGPAAEGAAAALWVLIPQKVVMPQGLSGHASGLASSAHPNFCKSVTHPCPDWLIWALSQICAEDV